MSEVLALLGSFFLPFIIYHHQGKTNASYSHNMYGVIPL